MASVSAITRLRSAIDSTWRELLSASPLTKRVLEEPVDRRLYALYLLETYHYTSHNARNQALVGVRHDNVDPAYAKFCFQHACEESGHEQMALRDLRSIGMSVDVARWPRPLPETQLLIAYLYWVSLQGNPVARLGYSAWAEDSYRYFQPFVDMMRARLQLGDGNLSFFAEHSGLDETHAGDVERALLEAARDEADWECVIETACVSLRLASGMVHAVYAEYVKLREGQPSAYEFLRNLGPT